MSTTIRPSASYSIIVRLRISNTPGSLGRVTSMISDLGGDIGAIDIKGVTKTHKIREITLQARDGVGAAPLKETLARYAGG